MPCGVLFCLPSAPKRALRGVLVSYQIRFEFAVTLVPEPRAAPLYTKCQGSPRADARHQSEPRAAPLYTKCQGSARADARHLYEPRTWSTMVSRRWETQWSASTMARAADVSSLSVSRCRISRLRVSRSSRLVR